MAIKGQSPTLLPTFAEQSLSHVADGSLSATSLMPIADEAANSSISLLDGVEKTEFSFIASPSARSQPFVRQSVSPHAMQGLPADSSPTAPASLLSADNVFTDFDEIPKETLSDELSSPADQLDLHALAKEFAKNEQWDKAENYYQTLLAIFPDNAELLTEAALVFHKQDRHADAIALLEPWLLSNPNSVLAIQAFGQALCMDNQFARCEKLLLGSLMRKTTSVKLYYWLGEAYRHQGKFRAAQTAYLLALRLSPQDMMLRMALVTLISESDPFFKDSLESYQKATNACILGNVEEATQLIQDALLRAVQKGVSPALAKNFEEGHDAFIHAVKNSGDATPDLLALMSNTTTPTPERLIIRAREAAEAGNRVHALKLLHDGMDQFTDSALLVCTYAEYLSHDSRLEALSFLERKLPYFPHDFRVLSLYGGWLLEQGNDEKALDALHKAHHIKTDAIDNNNTLIAACRKTNNLQLALSIIEKNITIQGQTTDNLLLLGTVHADIGNVGEASTYFTMVNQRDAADFRGLMAQALLYRKRGLNRDAILVLRAHLKNPAVENSPDFLFLLGYLLHDDGQLTDASQVIGKLVFSQPSHHRGRMLLAEILMKMGEHQQAAKHLRLLMQSGNADIKVMMDLAEICEWDGELPEAERLYQTVLDKKPNYPKARMNLGFCQLRQANFDQGLAAYEMMSATSPSTYPQVNEIPYWKGEPIKGKRLLVYQNCSASEVVLFARYFSYLRKMGATLHLLVDNSLVPLLISLSDICMDEPQEADYTIPLSSLPRVFNINLSRIPHSQAYLAPDMILAEPWDKLLGAQHSKLNVGLAWQSPVDTDKRNTYDKISSLNLQEFQALIESRAYNFVSLQLGEPGRTQENACSYAMRSSQHFANDWASIAAGIAKMDVVITNEQPVAHIAGALGIKTLVLLPGVAPWYWFADRNDSPWYQSVTLIRKQTMGDWFPLVGKVSDALAKLAKTR